MTYIRSYKRDVMTANIKKVGLSPYDDKRYVLEDKVTIFAHGHCSITKQKFISLTPFPFPRRWEGEPRRGEGIVAKQLQISHSIYW